MRDPETPAHEKLVVVALYSEDLYADLLPEPGSLSSQDTKAYFQNLQNRLKAEPRARYYDSDSQREDAAEEAAQEGEKD